MLSAAWASTSFDSVFFETQWLSETAASSRITAPVSVFYGLLVLETASIYQNTIGLRNVHFTHPATSRTLRQDIKFARLTASWPLASAARLLPHLLPPVPRVKPWTHAKRVERAGIFWWGMQTAVATIGGSSFMATWSRGTQATAITLEWPWAWELVLSCDPALLGLELLAIFLLGLGFTQLRALLWLMQPFYDDLTTFCKMRNLSITEIFCILTLSLGFIVFDAILAVSEDDILENVGYILLMCMGITALLILLLVDIQYFALISGASAGETTLRLIYTDFMNNLLCVTRITFCWIRYLFYDLQAELVDLAFHYADAADASALSSLTFQQAASPYATQGLLWGALAALSMQFLTIFLDVAIWLAQAVLGCIKLALALYLFWLIMDLSVLRSLVHAESTGLIERREWRRLPL